MAKLSESERNPKDLMRLARKGEWADRKTMAEYSGDRLLAMSPAELRSIARKLNEVTE